MKKDYMLTLLKELSSDLLRYAAGSDSIVPGAYCEALDEAIATLEHYRWREVPEEMPEPNEDVLLLVKGNPVVGWLNRSTNEEYDDDDDLYDDYWATYECDYYKKRVTHWMPLPELPEEDE